MQCCGICGWSGTNTPPDEGARSSTLASQRSANSAHFGKCRINSFKTVRTHPSRSTSAVALKTKKKMETKNSKLKPLWGLLNGLLFKTFETF